MQYKKKSKMLHSLTRWIFTRNAMPRWLVLMADTAVVFFAFLVMHALRFDLRTLCADLGPALLTILVFTAIFSLFFILFRTYKGVLRFSSMNDLVRVAGANAAAILVVFLVRPTPLIMRMLTPIVWEELVGVYILATAFMWGLRVAIKYIYEHTRSIDDANRVFIFGIRQGGMAIASGLSEDIEVVAFLTDTPSDTAHLLLNKPVYMADPTIATLMQRKHASTLMVSPLMMDYLRDHQEFTTAITSAGITIRVLGDNAWDGKSDISLAQLREVEIDDLLPRAAIHVDLDAIGRELRDRSILITGAAGSIGSEIVRQVATFHPSQLILIDQAETPLHDMRLYMAKNHPALPCITLCASICNQSHMRHMFSLHRPNYVFHAAAYKHVPMMEDNPGEAVYNNIHGTRIIADLAVEFGAEKFVMVSTDKAVNPTNVMGCSKRICEMYVQSLHMHLASLGPAHTQFVTTRFGNVLGSNGSVIPLFREQIRLGGPVTVTHPDIIRYFMLIPEACNLVLDAATQGKGGEIYVFDMGKPVRIADLAQRMIDLSGAHGVEIVYTGLRDGEKLYEELLAKDENTQPSYHPKIRVATVRQVDYQEVLSSILALEEAARQYDDMRTVALMKALVPEFRSKNSKYEQLDR